jgi:hypothetical protein
MQTPAAAGRIIPAARGDAWMEQSSLRAADPGAVAAASSPASPETPAAAAWLVAAAAHVPDVADALAAALDEESDLRGLEA